MGQPSDLTYLGFAALVAVVASLFVWALARSARAPGESPRETFRWKLLAVGLLALWLIPSGLAAARGALTFTGRPPTFFLLLALSTVGTTILAFTPVGTRLATGIGIGGLVGFQAFRFPLELLLHRLHEEGMLPIQMTFEGSNFDIVSGILGLFVGAWALRSRPPGWVVLGFNLIGLALLVTIVTIAILSMPTPLRRFQEGPSPTIVATWPFVWLPAFLVQVAWFGHLLVFRKLASR